MSIQKVILVAAMLAIPAGIAQAHVTLEQREAPVAAPYKAVFKVGHGCGASPTVKLRVRIPDGVIAVKPMPKAGWTIATETGKYDKAYSFYHGATLTEGVKEVAWSGKLDDKFYDEFVLSVFLSDSLKAGDVVYFPVVQECETGIHRWIEIPQNAGDGKNLKEPAPGLRLTPSK
jgi:uncharacterized protein YcnI